MVLYNNKCFPFHGGSIAASFVFFYSVEFWIINVHHQILLSDSHIRDWARFKWGLFALVIKEKWTSDEMNDRSSWKCLRSGKEEIERSFVANIVRRWSTVKLVDIWEKNHIFHKNGGIICAVYVVYVFWGHCCDVVLLCSLLIITMLFCSSSRWGLFRQRVWHVYVHFVCVCVCKPNERVEVKEVSRSLTQLLISQRGSWVMELRLMLMLSDKCCACVFFCVCGGKQWD